MAEELLVAVHGKKYKVAANEMPKLHKAVGSVWLKTAKSYENQMKAVHAIWKSHYDLREEYFFTSRALQAVTSAYFPTPADLALGDKAIQSLRAAAAAGNLAGIQKANDECYKMVSMVARAMDNYTKAMVSSATNLVTGTEFIRDGAKDGVEILSQIVLAKAPGGAAAAAGLSGGYNELLDQIEQAQAPNAPNVAVATALVIKSGASDALIKHFLSDGKFGGKIVEKLGEQAVKIIGKHIAQKEAVELVETMFKKQLEEIISSSLKELVKAYTPGSKLTWDQALHNVFNDVLKKTGAIQLLGKIPNQVAKVEGMVLDKIKKGVIKGVKLEGKPLEEEVKKLVANSVEKLLEKAIKGTSGKVDNLANALVDEIIGDTKFKADVTKAAQKK